MKKAVSVDISGLKCDNPNCNYVNMDIQVEDYKEWVNSKCPECGEILLTEADYNTTQMLLGIANLFNDMCPERNDEDQDITMRVTMNGSGEMSFDSGE